MNEWHIHFDVEWKSKNHPPTSELCTHYKSWHIATSLQFLKYFKAHRLLWWHRNIRETVWSLMIDECRGGNFEYLSP